MDFRLSKGKLLHLSLSYSEGPHFAAVNKNNEIIVTDFHNHSVKVRTQWLKKMYIKFRVSPTVNFMFLALLGFYSWRRITIKVWFQWWRKRPVQCSHWCSCGHQWQHHRGWLGQQQNPGTAVHLRGACGMFFFFLRQKKLRHLHIFLNDH